MNQRPIPWWWTELGPDEVDSVTRAIRDHHINRGPVCEQLERELARVLDVRHVALTCSGSAALVLALLACDVGPGDEVIIPAATFIATAHAPLLLGARVRLVDVRPDRPLMDAAQIESAITPRTKVIIPVHLNGCICDVQAIKAVANRHGLKVIEDCAQALGSRVAGKNVGGQGIAGTFSMSLSKLITTGEGGFVATEDDAVRDHLLRLRNQGVLSIPDNVFHAFGFNLRFNDLLASVGLAQAVRLAAKIDAVTRIYHSYQQELSGLHYLRMLEVRVDEGEVPLWTQVICSERKTVIDRLAERGIQTRPLNPCLADSAHLQCRGSFPNARFFGEHVLTLPCGPDQPRENLRRVVRALREIANDVPTPIDAVLERARNA